jgi:hypothetical protein
MQAMPACSSPPISSALMLISSHSPRRESPAVKVVVGPVGLGHVFSKLQQSCNSHANISRTFILDSTLEKHSCVALDMMFVKLESMLLDRQQDLLPGSGNVAS